VIELVDIHKKYNNVTAVDGVSVKIGKGELFGIVGPDGAGKSTLMKIFATTVEPEHGIYTIEGKNAGDILFSIREKIAYMPQRFGLYEDLTVEENVHFFGKMFGVNKNEIKAALPRLYKFSKLDKFHDRLAGKLSGGMKQKLGLICSLIHTPDILILDEPTNGVDPVSRREFWMILYELLSDGVTIIVSTAYLDEAERCARVALMDKGKFIAVDNPVEIKRSINRPFISLHTADPVKAIKTLSALRPAPVITRVGDSLRFFSPEGISAPKIEALLRTNRINFTSSENAQPSLEDCFLEKIGARSAAHRSKEIHQ